MSTSRVATDRWYGVAPPRTRRVYVPVARTERNNIMSPLQRAAFALVCVAVFFTPFGRSPTAAAEAPHVELTSTAEAGLDPSLANEVHAAVDRGLDWLAAAQKEDGAWSDGNFPAVTALALRAFLHGQHPDKERIARGALAHILSCVQEDGGIYRKVPGRKGGGLSNYNTAICMTALQATGDPSHTGVILNARRFVAGSQHFGDDVYRGGFGYDRATERAYADLMNTLYAAEAMAATAGAEDLRPGSGKRTDIDWSQTVEFIERLQNKPGTGDDAGGFFYNPTGPKAGTTTNEQGVVVFRSYGSITYAGLLALIYADISRDDVRVRSAFDWAAGHWTLDENPGMGSQGLFFFYHVLTRALAAYGASVVPAPDGAFVDWRSEIARKLVSLQRVDPKTGHGYWRNDAARFWEGDPVLVTAYSLLALQLLD